MSPRYWVGPRRVRKSWHGGVLFVNGQDDLAEQNVLNLADAPVSPTTGSTATRFDILFQRFYSELFGLVYRVLGDRMEAEDTLQEAFLKLSDDAGLQARPDGEVGAWLRRVAINLAFNRLRSAKRARARIERVGRLERSDEEPTDSDMVGPSGLLVRQEERRRYGVPWPSYQNASGSACCCVTRATRTPRSP